MRPTTRTSVFALSLLALAACADSGTTPAVGDDTSASAGEQRTADIDDFRFEPEAITVAAGTEVTWTNQDATAHTVTAGSEDDPSPDAFDLEVEAKGDTVSTTFDEPGTYPYYCELHPFMVGSVEVTG